MKRTLTAFFSLSMLLATTAFAENGGSDNKSAETNTLANVEALALSNCINNAKNEGFNCNSYVGCSERKSFVSSCMSGNDTPVQYASINRTVAPTAGNTAVADFNKMLEETPTAAGNK